jgi:hypothetical protein
MKMIRELGPMAIGVALFGVLIAVLLQGGNVAGNWLFAAFLLGHGWVHVMYLVPQPRATAAAANGSQYPFELDHSRALSALGLAPAAQRLLGTLLVAATIGGYLVAALATIPVIVPPSAWAGLVVASSVASLALLGLFFNRNLVVGVAIDVVLLAVAVSSVWMPAV